MSTILHIDIPEGFRAVADRAIMRASYLHPQHNFTLSMETIIVDAPTSTEGELKEIERDMRHLLYREKIFTETLALRKQLIEALTEK